MYTNNTNFFKYTNTNCGELEQIVSRIINQKQTGEQTIG